MRRSRRREAASCSKRFVHNHPFSIARFAGSPTVQQPRGVPCQPAQSRADCTRWRSLGSSLALLLQVLTSSDVSGAGRLVIPKASGRHCASVVLGSTVPAPRLPFYHRAAQLHVAQSWCHPAQPLHPPTLGPYPCAPASWFPCLLQSHAEAHFPRLEEQSGVGLAMTDTEGQTHALRLRFWANNQSRRARCSLGGSVPCSECTYCDWLLHC